MELRAADGVRIADKTHGAGGEGGAAGFPAGRRRRPVVSGKLRRHRSVRGAAEPERSRKSIAAIAGKAGPVTGCAHEE